MGKTVRVCGEAVWMLWPMQSSLSMRDMKAAGAEAYMEGDVARLIGGTACSPGAADGPSSPTVRTFSGPRNPKTVGGGTSPGARGGKCSVELVARSAAVL